MEIIETYPGKATGDDLIRHGYAEKHPHEITVRFNRTPEQLRADTTDHDLYNIVYLATHTSVSTPFSALLYLVSVLYIVLSLH